MTFDICLSLATTTVLPAEITESALVSTTGGEGPGCSFMNTCVNTVRKSENILMYQRPRCDGIV